MTTVTNLTTGSLILAQLANYNLKDCGGGRYRSHSPLRPGSDSQSFSLFIQADGEHGMYKDHVSDDAGSLYALARLMGIHRPESGDSSASSKRAYTGLGDYAAAHGATLEDFAAAGWREGRLFNRPVLFFPTKNGERWRFIDGANPKYGNKKGYQQCWYGLQKAMALLINSTLKTLVFVNGEASVVAAQSHGIAAVCLTNSGERSDIPPNLMHELKEPFIHVNANVLVAFDCDQKGRAAATPLANQLLIQGFDARAIDLNLGFAGADIADFCMLHGQSAAKMLAECDSLADIPLPTSSRRRWEIVSRDYMRSLPPVKWLVEGQIQKRAVNVLVGPPKQGKSFLAIEYASRLSQSMSVVYMLGEGDYGINPRVSAWEAHHKQLTDRNLHFCKGSVEIMLESDLDDFIAEIRPLKPGLVIVDTLARSMLIGDENSSRDMKLFLAGCSRLVEELDSTVLLVHHTRKDGGVYRGSNVLEGNVDVMLFLTMHDNLIELKSSALKEKVAGEALYFKLLTRTVETIEGPVESAVIIPSEQVLDDKLTRNQVEILKLIADEDEEYYRRDLVDVLRLPLGTVITAVKSLKKQGLIQASDKNRPYRLTDVGKETVESLESNESRNSKDSSLPIRDSVDSRDSLDSLDSLDSRVSSDFESHLESLGAQITEQPLQAAFIAQPIRYE